jgi:hypothetical protein
LLCGNSLPAAVVVGFPCMKPGGNRGHAADQGCGGSGASVSVAIAVATPE